MTACDNTIQESVIWQFSSFWQQYIFTGGIQNRLKQPYTCRTHDHDYSTEQYHMIAKFPA